MESNSGKPNRRAFLGQAGMFALTLPALSSSFALTACNANPAASAIADPGSVPWRTTIVGDSEPGEALIISGTIFSPDGRTPLEGINLFVYQTDAKGVYTTSGGDNRKTRINGAMRTTADGRYEFRTIRPGSYPGSRNPQHIHAYVSGPGYPEYWIDEYHFADDPFISEDQRQRAAALGTFAPILTLKKEGGIWRGVRDIKIEKCSRNCT